jgi:hypothetical protein
MTITATKQGYISDTKIISIVHDPDTSDESGTSGTLRLEFTIDRTEFWEENPTEVNVNLKCFYNRWDWINHIHWADHDQNNHWGTFMVYTTNQLPHIESFTGPSEGKVNEAITFYAKASDADDDKVQYWFDWDGDGVFWEYDATGFYDPDIEISVSYTWIDKYEGPIYVIVLDKLEGQSDNYGQIDINIIKSKSYSNPIIQKILEYFPMIQKILNQPMIKELLIQV